MYYGRTCLAGVHVLQECMSCRSACLQDGISLKMMCLTGMHFLQEDTSYLRVCLIGGHVLQAYMSYRSTCFTGWHILQDDLQEDMFYRRADLTGVYIL